MAKKKKFAYGELRDLILESLADFLIDMGGYPRGRANVLLGLLIKYILEKKRVGADKGKIKRALENLEKRRLIQIEETDDKAIVWVEEKGKPVILGYSLKKILEFKRKEKRWDGRWFIVFFDVPELERNKRNYLREFLLKIGFRPYQKSVYIFPYECEEEVRLIKKIVEGAKYIRYVVAEKIEDEIKFRRIFKL